MKFRDSGYGSALYFGKQNPSLLSGGINALLSRLGMRKGTDKPIIQIPTITLDTLMGRIGRAVDLLQMDVQGLELAVLQGGVRSLQDGTISTFLIGSHGLDIHTDCIQFLERNGYQVDLEIHETKEQPDGIIVASKGVSRLSDFKRPQT